MSDEGEWRNVEFVGYGHLVIALEQELDHFCFAGGKLRFQCRAANDPLMDAFAAQRTVNMLEIETSGTVDVELQPIVLTEIAADKTVYNPNSK